MIWFAALIMLHGLQGSPGAKAVAAEAKVDRPPEPVMKIEEMAYSAARRLILGRGWHPVPGNCGGGDAGSAETCQRFPEVGYCSGSSPAIAI
jgi:hypothetical protein